MHRSLLLGLVCLVAVLAEQRSALAAWPPEGVPLCSDCDASGLLMLPDGAGGAFVAWARFGGDISLQRVTAAGSIASGWPSEGLLVTSIPRPQDLNSIAPDGFGGVLVAWTDHRNSFPDGTTGLDVYVQRVRADGTLAPGWPANGVPATRAPGLQTFPVVAGDGLGGAYVSWDDETLWDIFLQHLTAAGQVASGWPLNGLPVSVHPSTQGAPQVVSDGSGGVILLWGDFRDGPIAAYAQHVLPDGTIALGWSGDGTRIVLNRYIRQLMPDGAGGAYLACATAVPHGDDDYFLQRFTGAGTIAPGWPAGGAVVCQAPDIRFSLRMVPDGAGGVLLAWADYRDFSDDEIFLLRMRGDGTRFPGWPVDGQRVTDNTLLDSIEDLAPDGMGGAYLSWDRYLGPSVGEGLALHHLSGTGANYPGWAANGLSVPSDVQAFAARITEDGMGGAIVAWIRADPGVNNIRALRLGPDGPVAVAISLVSAEAEAGRVRLTWFAAGAPSLAFQVERRTETSEWQPLATLTPDGTGRIEYEDRDVAPGTRHAYRLAYTEDGTEHVTAETWVVVPRLELALKGFQPNPSVGIPTVAFVLAEAAPAALEVFDVAGRRVANREVGTLGPGRHVIPLDAGARLTPGVYAIRLVQGERVLRARGVVTR